MSWKPWKNKNWKEKVTYTLKVGLPIAALITMGKCGYNNIAQESLENKLNENRMPKNVVEVMQKNEDLFRESKLLNYGAYMPSTSRYIDSVDAIRTMNEEYIEHLQIIKTKIESIESKVNEISYKDSLKRSEEIMTQNEKEADEEYPVLPYGLTALSIIAASYGAFKVDEYLGLK